MDVDAGELNGTLEAGSSDGAAAPTAATLSAVVMARLASEMV